MATDNRRKLLKAAGLINYPANKVLSKGEKSYVTRQFNKHNLLFSRPEAFTSVLVSNKRAKDLPGAAYAIKRGKKTRVYYYGEKIEVKRKSIIVTEGIYKNELFDTEGGDIFKQIEKLSKKKMGPMQSLTISIDGRQWNTTWADKHILQAYLKDFQPKKGGSQFGWSKTKLLAHMQIVTVKMPEGNEGFLNAKKEKRSKASSNRF